MGTKRCRVAIAEPNCIITNEQPDAIGFGGYASRESSLLMTCRDFGDYCMFSLAEGFGKSDPAAASLI